AKGPARGCPACQRPRLACGGPDGRGLSLSRASARPDTAQQAVPASCGTHGGGLSVRILVVEDSVKMAGLLKKGLEREGYAVDVASSGEDATWLAAEHDYDAMVLDVILGSGESLPDGFAVCRQIRAAGCQTPVLMVTARDAVQDRVYGLDTGAE